MQSLWEEIWYALLQGQEAPLQMPDVRQNAVGVRVVCADKGRPRGKMRVIDVLRTYHSVDGWVRFVDMDAKEHNKIWSKPMKVKNITWDRLRHIEYKYVVSINFSQKDGCLIIRHRGEKSKYDR